MAVTKGARPKAWRRGRAVRLPLAETETSIADALGALGLCAAFLGTLFALLYGMAWACGKMKGWW